MGLLSLCGCSHKTDLDQSVRTQLRHAGSDLSRPHHIRFFLYFPTQAAAEQAASKIRAAGYDVKVEPAATGSDWLCFTTKTMVPGLPALRTIRIDFDNLAASLGGRYDGWGAGVEK
jgi:Regulator of ribonuclease activity B